MFISLIYVFHVLIYYISNACVMSHEFTDSYFTCLLFSIFFPFVSYPFFIFPIQLYYFFHISWIAATIWSLLYPRNTTLWLVGLNFCSWQARKSHSTHVAAPTNTCMLGENTFQRWRNKRIHWQFRSPFSFLSEVFPFWLLFHAENYRKLISNFEERRIC